jgi:hypothetical protein
VTEYSIPRKREPAAQRNGKEIERERERERERGGGEEEKSLHDMEITVEPLIVTNVFLIACFTFCTCQRANFFSFAG